MSALRQILWHRLDSLMRTALGEDWTERKLVLYGAGGLGRSFMQTFPQLSFAYAVDSDPKRTGDTFEGLPVAAPEALTEEDRGDLAIFITSSWHQEIRQTLEGLDLVEHQHFFYGNQQAHGRIFFYLPDMADFDAAFEWLDEQGVEYSILRWFETLPEKTPGDIDLLVQTDDLPRLFDNPFLRSQPGGVPLEVYWSRPLGQEDELLYYPTWLARKILDARVRLASGAFGQAGETYLASLAYHVVFHKAERAGLPRDASANGSGDAPPNKYREKLLELAAAVGAEVEPTLDGLWRFLAERDWLPPVDHARRYATTLDSPWLLERVGPLPNAREDVLLFVFREWLVARPRLLARVVDALERVGLERIDVVSLSEAERARATERIRGGNWFETEESREGGGPAAFALFLDPSPAAPSAQDRLLRPFCANRKLTEKTPLKQRIARDHNEGAVVNFLHAADDEREVLEYLDCLAPERRAPVRQAIDDARRDADAPRWPGARRDADDPRWPGARRDADDRA